MKKRIFFLFTLLMMISLTGCIIDAPNEIGFEIDTENVTLSFAYNEDFSSEGLVVKAVFDNNTNKVLKSGYTIDANAFKKGVAGSYLISVKYKDFEPLTYEVTVRALEEVGFIIDTSNVKKEFILNSSFESDNLVVMAKLEDDSLVPITEYTVDFTLFKNDELGTYLISVRYKDYEPQTYEVSVVTDIVELIVDASKTRLLYGLKNEFDATGLCVSVKKTNDEIVPILDFDIDASAFVKGVSGTYDIVVSYQGFEVIYQVTVNNEVHLSTPEDVVAMIESGINVGEEYLLLNDIDMTDVLLTYSNSTIAGILNGQGFTIKNITSTATQNKRGVFFRYMDGTAVIKNINFKDSVYNGAGEGASFLTCIARGGAVFENITFSEVGINHNHNYTGLLFALTDTDSDDPVVITKINVFNETAEIKTDKYAAGLIGYLTKKMIVDISYVYFNGKVTSLGDESCSAVIARVANEGVVINIDNVVIEGLLDGGKNVGALVGTSSAGTLNVTNTVINNLILKSKTSAVDVLIGNDKLTTNIDKTYYISDQVTLFTQEEIKTPTQGTTILSTDMTLTWFEESGLDTQYWKLDQTSIVLNDKQVTTETGFMLDISKVQLSFSYDEDFNYEKLAVKALLSNDSFVYVANFIVDASLFVKGVPGTYDIKVSYKDYGIQTYEVTVLAPQATKITLDTSLVQVEFELGTPFNYDGLVVIEHYENDTEVEVFGFSVDTSLFNTALPGTYLITVIYGDHLASYEVEVYTLEVVGFEIDTTDVQKIFERGEQFNYTNLVVKEKYQNNKSAPTLEYSVDASLFQTLIPGDYEISVLYGEYEALTYTVTVLPADIKALYIDTSNVKLTYARNHDFLSAGLVVSATNLDDELVILENYCLDANAFQKGVVGTYEIVISYQGYEKTFEVEVIDEFHLGTSEDVVAMIESGINVGEEYLLLNDIDMTDVLLTYSNSTIAGILNGQGFTIKNITSTATQNKRGVFFRYMDGTAVIKDINFVDSQFNSGGEAGAFLTCIAQGGAVFENITFSEVAVITTVSDSSYGGLLFGDTNGDSTSPITISQITVNNVEAEIIAGKYSGGLIGRINHLLTVNLSYIYFNGIVKSIADESCASIIGRIGKGNINFDNVVIEGKLNGIKNVGALVGTSSAGTLNATNIVINNFEAKSTTSAIDIIGGNTKSMTTNIQKVYYISDQVTLYNGTNIKTPTQGTPILSTDMTLPWFEESGLDTTYWQLVGTRITRV